MPNGTLEQMDFMLVKCVELNEVKDSEGKRRGADITNLVELIKQQGYSESYDIVIQIKDDKYIAKVYAR